MTMEIVKYLVPDWCFPRYQYSKKIRQDLAVRYHNLIGRLGRDNPSLENYQSEFKDETICIFLCQNSSSKEVFPSIRSVLSRTSDTFIKEELPKCHTLKDLVKEIHFEGHTYVITNSEDDIVTLPKRSTGHVILIGKDEKDRVANLRTSKYQNIDICLVEEISKVISTHLERYAFTGMKTACENLVSILKETTLEDSGDRFEKTLVEIKPTGKENDADIGTEDAKGNKQRSQSAREQKIITQIRDCVIRRRSLSEYDSSEQGVKETNGSITALSKDNKESVKRLLDEIVGMFNRSNLPKTEHPHLHDDLNKKVNETLLNKLQQLDGTIQGCGYRFSTFQVYVKEESSSKSQNLDQQIKHLLEQYNITEFEIVSSNINEFATCHVGRKLAVKHVRESYVNGTLGGFAFTSSGNTEKTWALMSRHVAKFSSDGKVYVTNGEDRKVATIMKQINEDETEKQYLDIAAASLDHENVCDTRYITERNKSVKGKLFEYNTEKLRGLPVHIKGASTRLGLGTITIPEQTSVQNDGLCENYIVVEDRDENGAFCKEGDSGAIVCAENPDNYGEEVQLISMVVGENCSRKGSYTTIRLDKGLAELESLTEKKFNLC